MRKLILPLILALMPIAGAQARTITPRLAPEGTKAWRFVEGDWRLQDGVLEQQRPERRAAAILKEPCLADFNLSVELNIRAEGNGVRAAALLFRATGTQSYYWLHLDARNGNIILVRSTPRNNWIEIARRATAIQTDAWHRLQVRGVGPKITVSMDGAQILSVEDKTLTAGRIGLGTSQGRVAFRNLSIEGEATEVSEPLKEETPPYRVISRGDAAGTYQAFPDACRLQNGDILCVFYAGYGHVSLPKEGWPKGGRICMVRSRDEGRTWSAPQILFDDAEDNRDPHIAQLSDGTLICSFFSLRAKDKGYEVIGAQLARSRDGGITWDREAETVLPGWACSAPIRQMADGVCFFPVYCEVGGKAWGAVLRSTDLGKSWSAPIPIGKDSGVFLDAETDLIRLKDGSIFAALRSSKENMHTATSADGGLTWTPVQDIGFKGHCPHLTRLSTGAILMTQRLPATALYVSSDECKSWRGPYQIDSVGGAYPATVELKDGSVLVVYYEEGEGSAIRAQRFRLKPDGIETLPFTEIRSK